MPSRRVVLPGVALLLWSTHHPVCSAFTTPPPNQQQQQQEPLTTVAASSRPGQWGSRPNNNNMPGNHFLERVDTLIDQGPPEQRQRSSFYARQASFPRPVSSHSQPQSQRPYNYEQSLHNYRRRIPVGYRTSDALRRQLEDTSKPAVMRISASKNESPKIESSNGTAIFKAGLTPEELVEASRARIVEQQKKLEQDAASNSRRRSWERPSSPPLSKRTTTTTSAPQRPTTSRDRSKKMPRYKVKTMAVRAKTFPSGRAQVPSNDRRPPKIRAQRDNRVEELIKAAANAKDRNFDATPASVPKEEEDTKSIENQLNAIQNASSSPVAQQPKVEVKPDVQPPPKPFVQQPVGTAAAPTSPATDSLEQRLENLKDGRKVVRDNKVETLIQAAVAEQRSVAKTKNEGDTGTPDTAKLQADPPNADKLVDPTTDSSNSKSPASPKTTTADIDALHKATKKVIDIETVETVISRHVNDDFYDDVRMRSRSVRNVASTGSTEDVPMDVEFVKSSRSSSKDTVVDDTKSATNTVSDVIDAAVSAPAEQTPSSSSATEQPPKEQGPESLAPVAKGSSAHKMDEKTSVPVVTKSDNELLVTASSVDDKRAVDATDSRSDTSKPNASPGNASKADVSGKNVTASGKQLQDMKAVKPDEIQSKSREKTPGAKFDSTAGGFLSPEELPTTADDAKDQRKLDAAIVGRKVSNSRNTTSSTTNVTNEKTGKTEASIPAASVDSVPIPTKSDSLNTTSLSASDGAAAKKVADKSKASIPAVSVDADPIQSKSDSLNTTSLSRDDSKAGISVKKGLDKTKAASVRVTSVNGDSLNTTSLSRDDRTADAAAVEKGLGATKASNPSPSVDGDSIKSKSDSPNTTSLSRDDRKVGGAAAKKVAGTMMTSNPSPSVDANPIKSKSDSPNATSPSRDYRKAGGAAKKVAGTGMASNPFPSADGDSIKTKSTTTSRERYIAARSDKITAKKGLETTSSSLQGSTARKDVAFQTKKNAKKAALQETVKADQNEVKVTKSILESDASLSNTKTTEVKSKVQTDASSPIRDLDASTVVSGTQSNTTYLSENSSLADVPAEKAAALQAKSATKADHVNKNTTASSERTTTAEGGSVSNPSSNTKPCAVKKANEVKKRDQSPVVAKKPSLDDRKSQSAGDSAGNPSIEKKANGARSESEKVVPKANVATAATAFVRPSKNSTKEASPEKRSPSSDRRGDATLAAFDASKIKEKVKSTGIKISDFASRFQESDSVRSAQLVATEKQAMLKRESRTRADASVFSLEAQRVPPRTLQGVALMTAVLSTFVAGNDPITTAVAIPVTSFLGLCRGKTGNVTRALGDIAMDCVETVNTMFDEQQGNIVEALVLTSQAAITTVASGMKIYQQTREELARINGARQDKDSVEPSNPVEGLNRECKATELTAKTNPTTYDDDLQGLSFPSTSDTPLHFASFVETPKATEIIMARKTSPSARTQAKRTGREQYDDMDITTNLKTMERIPAPRPTTAVVEETPFQSLSDTKAEVNARALLAARLELERMKNKKP